MYRNALARTTRRLVLLVAAVLIGTLVSIAPAQARCPIDDPCPKAKTLAQQARDGDLGGSGRFVLAPAKRAALRDAFQGAYASKRKGADGRKDDDHWWDHFAEGVYCAYWNRDTSSMCAAKTAADYISDAAKKVPVKAVLACSATAGYAVWRAKSGNGSKLYAIFIDKASACGFALFVQYILDQVNPFKAPRLGAALFHDLLGSQRVGAGQSPT